MIVTIVKVDRLVNWGARDQKTGKLMPMYEHCTDKLVPGLHSETGALRTGLTPEDERELEEELTHEEGTLKKSSKFWDNFSVIIPGKGLRLNTENPAHRLQYLVLNADPTIAKSLVALKTHAGAEYVMTSEGDEAKSSNSKRDVITKAYVAFSKLSKTDIVDALYMFGKFGDDVSPDVAENRLGDIVDNDPHKFISIVGDKLFKDKVWMMKLIRENIVKKHGTGTGTNMPLYYEDIMLGNGLEEAIAFVKAKENNIIALGMKKAFKG